MSVVEHSAGSLRDQVYQSIRADLMSGKIAPDQRLSEERLAQIHGVSRTPVREALARLQSDGLVQRGEHGLYPYRPRLEELDGLYELRILLELQGIRRVLDTEYTRHDVDVLGAELERWYKLRARTLEPDTSFVTLDEEFHTALLVASGNPALTEALAHVNARIRPVRMFDNLTPAGIEAIVEEHIAIAELVLDNKLPEALDSLQAHIDYGRLAVLERAHQALSLAALASAVRY
ncbi:GntR family transcriptional regulator [Rhodococcus sp. IEGM 1379]|uniref:GntR family transcriptional regulator n=1 Tax=Rhodococcus sp. IEGM 1379 TaxID=3047086 RepID=UPI0024B654A5|nr:GntR family transcriptional regulator [Rhodococcus sp. IEGM 1379]MDI9919164.1 GntR family transcriptional regulator [Rhodococcus sp. IEGM 1379]